LTQRAQARYVLLKVGLHWRRGSVVRTSVCSRRTFPDLRLIHGWRVTTLWVRRPLWVNQLGQLSLPSLRGRLMSSNLARSAALLSTGVPLWWMLTR